MRKPRDYEAELAALTEKAKALKTRKVFQLGELVIVAGADALPIDVLAGALVAAVTNKDDTITEAWRQAGTAMFSGGPPRARRSARNAGSKSANAGGAQPPSREART